MKKLKPCPLCGSEAILCDYRRTILPIAIEHEGEIRCVNCNVSLWHMWFETTSPGVKAINNTIYDIWNRRINDERTTS